MRWYSGVGVALVNHPVIHGHLPRFSAVCCGTAPTWRKLRCRRRNDCKFEGSNSLSSFSLSFHPVPPLPVPLRSARYHQLSVPRVRRNTFGTRAFSVTVGVARIFSGGVHFFLEKADLFLLVAASKHRHKTAKLSTPNLQISPPTKMDFLLCLMGGGCTYNRYV